MSCLVPPSVATALSMLRTSPGYSTATNLLSGILPDSSMQRMARNEQARRRFAESHAQTCADTLAFLCFLCLFDLPVLPSSKHASWSRPAGVFAQLGS